MSSPLRGEDDLRSRGRRRPGVDSGRSRAAGERPVFRARHADEAGRVVRATERLREGDRRAHAGGTGAGNAGPSGQRAALRAQIAAARVTPRHSPARVKRPSGGAAIGQPRPALTPCECCLVGLRVTRCGTKAVASGRAWRRDAQPPKPPVALTIARPRGGTGRRGGVASVQRPRPRAGLIAPVCEGICHRSTRPSLARFLRNGRITRLPAYSTMRVASQPCPRAEEVKSKTA